MLKNSRNGSRDISTTAKRKWKQILIPFRIKTFIVGDWAIDRHLW